MIKFIYWYIAIVATVITVTDAVGEKFSGPGRWYVLAIQQCPNHEDYPDYKFIIQRKKLTRDQDAYNAEMDLRYVIDEKYGIRMDICKHVDGGCKPCQVLSDDSFVNFVRKYIKSELEKALTIVGIDPPDFPVPEGNYRIENFIFNYCALPTDGLYGKFGVEAYLLLDDEEVGCISITVEFRELEGACDGNDEETSDEEWE